MKDYEEDGNNYEHTILPTATTTTSRLFFLLFFTVEKESRKWPRRYSFRLLWVLILLLLALVLVVILVLLSLFTLFLLLYRHNHHHYHPSLSFSSLSLCVVSVIPSPLSSSCPVCSSNAGVCAVACPLLVLLPIQFAAALFTF